jgi:hypothetical protein
LFGRPKELVSAVAHHEGAHALATVLAFRDAAWLPRPAPSPVVSFVEITNTSGQWIGCCRSRNIYSGRNDEPCRDLMEKQIGIYLAGAVGEAISRSVVRWDEVEVFAATDLQRAAAVGNDLSALTGVPYDEQFFFKHTRALLKANWPAIEALATALIAHGRIDGDQVERIIDGA